MRDDYFIWNFIPITISLPPIFIGIGSFNTINPFIPFCCTSVSSGVARIMKWGKGLSINQTKFFFYSFHVHTFIRGEIIKG